VKGLQKVELSWSGASSASFDVYRDGQRIAAVSNSSYIDNLNRKRPGSYSYKVCQTESAICSNQATWPSEGEQP
jgi:serine protease